LGVPVDPECIDHVGRCKAWIGVGWQQVDVGVAACVDFVAILVEQEMLGDRQAQRVEQPPIRHHQREAGVAHLEIETLGRVARIERHVCGTAFQHREHGR
jgi:hypothetical protein